MEAEREEEREVLQSIYEGDTNFSQIEDNLFQYKFSDFGVSKNFVLEIRWGSNYPEEAPEINLDVFYNKHICSEVKEAITAGVKEQAEMMLGMSMTFSLIEWLKDNCQQHLALQDQLTEAHKSSAASDVTSSVANININDNSETSKPVTKKKDANSMSKNQKRKMWDRQNAAGERERGYDWVDVIKHLSQTGSAATS